MIFTAQFTLNIDFTLSAWIRRDSIASSSNVIFSKDDNATSPVVQLKWQLAADGSLEFYSLSSAATSSTSQVTSGQWTFVSLSVQLNADALTDTVAFLIDSTADTPTTTASGEFFKDDASAYTGIVGAMRNTDQSTYADNFAGFIYGFYVDNTYITTTPRSQQHQGACTGCTSSICAATDTECLDDWEFGEYAPAENCATGCEQTGCVHSYHCHLCYDAMCTTCSDYAEGSCSDCTYNAGGSGTTNCSCAGAYVRLGDDTQLLCAACHDTCSTCTTGGLGNYSDCTACDGTASGKGISIHSNILYCADYCPTGLTDNTNTCDGSPGAIFGATFEGFSSLWTTSTVTISAQGPYPAKERGRYFKGSGSTDHMVCGDMLLNVRFTVSSWARVDAIGSDMSIFSKDNDAADPEIAFRAYIKSDGTLTAYFTDPTNLTDSETKSGTSSITAQQWTFVAISVDMDNGATSSTTSFIINDASEVATSTTTGKYWVDAAALINYVGTTRGTASNDFTDMFQGFMYGFWVDNTYLTATSSHYFEGTCNCADSMLCATADGECMRNIDFDQTPAGAACDPVTCADIGCVRDGECQDCTPTFDKCHLCADRECKSCSDYDVGSCTECDFTSGGSTLGTGACTCNAGFARAGDSIDLVCAACHTNCNDCTTGGLGNYSDCNGCTGDFFQIFNAGTFCTDYCPTGWDAGCVNNISGDYVAITFNTFASNWTANSFTVLTNDFQTINAAATYPAYERGIYFVDYYISFNDSSLALDWTISGWMRPDDLSTKQTFYSKTDGSHNVLFRGFINTDGTIGATIAQQSDTSQNEDHTSSAGTVSAGVWAYLAFAVRLQTSATQDEITFAIGAAQSAVTTTVGYYFLDRNGGTASEIGARKTGSATYDEYFGGFFYNFFIDDNYLTSISARMDQSSCTNCSSSCAGGTADCLANLDITAYDGGSCAGGCDRGCRRGEACQTCDGSDTLCHLCFDVECTKCTDYDSGSCETGKCLASGNSAVGTGTCACNSGYGRASEDELCKTCHTNCGSCTASETGNYAACTGCSAGTFNTSTASYFFCTTFCPTGFTDAGAPSCTAPSTQAQQVIASYDFNVPTVTFTNAGAAAGAVTLSVTRVDPSGHPAKDRGLYFNGTDDTGRMTVSSLLLSHTFAFHTWVLLDESNTHTLFVKDRNDYASAGANRHVINFSVANGLMILSLAEDDDGSNTQQLTGSTPVPGSFTGSGTAAWSYLVYSVEMELGSQSKVEIFYNNVLDGTDDFAGKFLIDNSSYNTFLAAETADGAAYVNTMKGFMYQFHIYSIAHVDTQTDHVNDCATCSTLAFDEYSVGNQCDNPTCLNRSCVRSGACAATTACDTGFDFCHLCADPECKLCNTYTGGCETGQCNLSGYSSESAGVCSCTTGAFRADTTVLCLACHTDCTACTTGGLVNYSDCTTCSDQSLAGPETVFCVAAADCPSGFDGTCSLGGASAKALSLEFNFPTDSFPNTGSGSADLSGIQIGLDSSGSGWPSKNRGVYLNGTNVGTIDVSAIKMNHTFSIHTWIFKQSTDAMTVYSRDRNDFATSATSHQHLKLSIGGGGSNDKLVADIAQDIDSSNFVQVVSTATISSSSWTYLVYSFKFQGGSSTNVNFYIANTDDGT